MPLRRLPRWYGIPVRVGLVTLIGTLLSFSLFLLLGIVGALIVSVFLHVRPDMTVTYRRIAFPGACTGGALIFLFTLVTEIRHYQRSKALSALERME